MDNAFDYAHDNALVLESDYSYLASKGTCSASSYKGVFTISGHVEVESNSSDALKTAIAQQPISVAIEADKDAFRLYGGGIITADANCGTSLNHGVLAVGYGVEGDLSYYIVKNSWSDTWGEAGFVRLEINDEATQGAGVCGIQLDPSYPIGVVNVASQ
jgi:C1A family cysteine protease